MRRVVERPVAVRELEGHAHYIARHDLDAAYRLLDAVERTYDMLLEMPEIGKRARAFTDPRLEGLRYLAVRGFRNYLVFYVYRRNEEVIEVRHILHGAQDIPRALRE